MSSPARPTPAVDEEQEVDFGRYWLAVVNRWWLPVLGLVLGAIVGFLVSSGGSRPYFAQATVYLGQPFAPNGTTPVQTLPTQLGFVTELATAKATVANIAAKVGVRPGRLSAGISTKAVSGLTRGRVDQPAPLVQVTVRGLTPRKNVQAADALASSLAQQFSSYVDVKLQTYGARLERANRELKAVNQRLAQAQEQQAQVLTNQSIGAAEKLIVLANLNNVIQFNVTRQANLEQSQLGLRDQVALAQQVERARVLEPASSHRESAPSRRTGAIVGLLIGLIVGVFAAVLWDPVARFWRSRNAPA